MLKLLLVIGSGALSTFLFKLAAGGLGVRSFNIVNITYYMYFILVYIGASAIYLGFASDYYLVNKLSQSAIDNGYYMIALAGVILPFFAWLAGQLTSRSKNLNVQYQSFMDCRPFIDLSERKVRTVVIFLMVICFLCTLYTFISIGSVPFLEVLMGGSEEAVSMRAQAKIGFGGLIQIRNLGMLQLAPLIAFLCLICYRTMTPSKWKWLFYFSVVWACIALTYNLEKAPIVFFAFELLVLELLLGKKFSSKQIFRVGIALVILLLLMYFFIAGESALVFSFTAGPIGRAILAYPAAFMLHVQCFPDILPFLGGAGLPDFIEQAIGAYSGMGRSAVAVMTVFNTQKSTVGLAYAMNSFFPAEAYANWSIPGYFFSLLWVGCLMGIIHTFFITHEKKLSSILIYILILRFQVQVLLGGFIDYLYSINLIFLIAVVICVKLICFSSKKHNTSG